MPSSAPRTTAVAALFLATASTGALAAGDGGPTEGYVASYTLEDIEDGTRVRITLTDEAIARLGIETAEVVIQKPNRSFLIGGDVVDEPASLAIKTGQIARLEGQQGAPVLEDAPATTVVVAEKHLWVSFPVTEDTENSSDLPVLVRTFDGSAAGTGIEALPEGTINRTVNAEDGGRLFYRIDRAQSGLKTGQRVLIEIPFAGNGEDHTVVPYSSILYDENGDEWVYVNPEPQVFVREAIDIAFVDGANVVLLEGPAPGTRVVSVGAAELLGTEYRVGH